MTEPETPGLTRPSSETRAPGTATATSSTGTSGSLERLDRDVLVVMAVTDPDAAAQARPRCSSSRSDTPGVDRVRDVPNMGAAAEH